MNILVTGAAGFIGSHLCDRLAANGHTVWGVDNLLTGRRENIAEDADWFWKGDICDPQTFGIFGKQDLIVHCAASYDDRDKWHRDSGVNVQGSINVGIAARRWDARVLYFQTALIYGNNPYIVANKDGKTGDEGPWSVPPHPLPAYHRLDPESSYAISKLAGGQYLRLTGQPLLEFRLANIYGPRNLSGPIPAFYKRVTAGEPCTIVNTRRDFVYVDDLVSLVSQAIDMEATGVYHASTGRDFAIGQVYDAVVDALDAYGGPEPRQVEPEPDDAATILLDPSDTQRTFSWVATTELDEGVAQAVAWYRQHGVANTYTHLKVKG